MPSHPPPPIPPAPRAHPAEPEPWTARALGRLRGYAAPAAGPPGWLWPRWLFLRALGLVFLSAFYSLRFQLHGLVGDRGILPAALYLEQVARVVPGWERFWLVPTALWARADDAALTALVAVGTAASLLLVVNAWPRLAAALSTLAFMSCVAALQDFSSYQSDGMLLEAGFLATVLAPRGRWPGLGAADPPLRAGLLLLRWEWFRIYFFSGVVKLASGDVQWRTLTAMDHYYENGPLPAWPGWYVQQLPHLYHAATAALTLVVELALVWAVFLPRRFRIAGCVVVTALQVGIIATANYAFLNYLVLVLGVLLLDDAALVPVLRRLGLAAPPPHERLPDEAAPRAARVGWRRWPVAAVLAWHFAATLFPAVRPEAPALLTLPARTLAPFRIANQYGLFAVMTTARYEIEFQGSRDGRRWVAYPFRDKPQDPHERPGLFAPYQPRFDWNLWFASNDAPEASPWIVFAEARLLEGSPSVLALFRANPFPGAPPAHVRTVLWQYWFTDLATRRRTGAWWHRRELGPFTVGLTRDSAGRVHMEPAR